MSTYSKLAESRQKTERGEVFWSRVAQDGVPFRSSGPVPLMTEDEYDLQTNVVKDPKVGTFNTSIPDMRLPVGDPSARTYQEILENIQSGAFELIFRDHSWHRIADDPPIMFVYIEWSEVYREPKRNTAQTSTNNKPAESDNARTKFLGSSQAN